MFERGRDQASGLRGLFAPAPLSLVPVGCTTGDALDRAGAFALARALQRSGRCPLLMDVLDADPLAHPGHDDRDDESPGDRYGESDDEDWDENGAAACDGERRAGRANHRAASSYGQGEIVRIDARRLLAAGTDCEDLAVLSRSLRDRALRSGSTYDVIVLAADPLRLADLTAGITDRLLLLARTDAASIARVYAQVKAVGLAHDLARHLVVFQDAPSPEGARGAHRRLAQTADRFLDARVDFGGCVASRAHDDGTWDRVAAGALRWARPIDARPAAMIN